MYYRTNALAAPSRAASPPPLQDSLPAGGLRLCREGVEPSGPLRKVSGYIPFPFPELTLTQSLAARMCREPLTAHSIKDAAEADREAGAGRALRRAKAPRSPAAPPPQP